MKLGAKPNDWVIRFSRKKPTQEISYVVTKALNMYNTYM